MNDLIVRSELSLFHLYVNESFILHVRFLFFLFLFLSPAMIPNVHSINSVELQPVLRG